MVLWHTGAGPGKPETVAKTWEQSLSPEQLARTARFYIRGGFDYGRLRGTDRLVMWAMRATLRVKRRPTAADRGMLAMYDEPVTDLDPEAVTPLVEHVRDLLARQP